MPLIINTKELGEQIRQLRKEKNITQRDASGLCGVGVRFLSDLENGKETIHMGKALRVLKGFGLEVYLEKRGLPK